MLNRAELFREGVMLMENQISTRLLRKERRQLVKLGVCFLLMISQYPASAQMTQDGYPGRDRASVREGMHKKKGVYLSPDNCEPQGKNIQIDSMKSALSNARKPFDLRILDGLHPYKVEPFSRLIVGLNSKYNIYVIDDPSVLKGHPCPAVYSASTSLFGKNSIGRASADLGWTGIHNEGQTLMIREFGSFIVLTDRLDSVRCQDNSTTILHDLDQANLRLFMTNNGTVSGDGQVKDLNLVITHNGTANLQKLNVGKIADITLFSNGTAHINCSGYLQGKSYLPEQIKSYGSPKRLELARLTPAQN
jgi:hypothetical protein